VPFVLGQCPCYAGQISHEATKVTELTEVLKHTRVWDLGGWRLGLVRLVERWRGLLRG
jgi:hypothetical protein